MENFVKSIRQLRAVPRNVALIGMGTFFIFFLSGCYLFPKEEAVLAPPLKEPPKVTYELVDVKRGTIERKINCTGSYVPVKYSNIFFKNRGGRLKDIFVNIGSEVKAGDLLAQLDTDTLESQIKQQELAVKKAEINYNQLKDTKVDQSSIEKLNLDVELARLQLNDLQKELDKVNEASNKLGDKIDIKDVFPSLDVDSLKSQIEQKKIALSKAEAARAEALNNQAQTEEANKYAVDKALLDLESAKLQLESLMQEYEKSKLYAPISGVVDFIDKVEVGQNISPYSTLIRIVDPTQLQLKYSGDKISEFVLGMKVDVNYKGQIYEGEVVMNPYNVPADANESLKKSVLINVKGLPKEVKMGDSSVISLTLEKKENVIIIPKSVVRRYLNRTYVQILENGIKKERDIEIGIQTDTEVEVIKGLQEGDKVIAR